MRDGQKIAKYNVEFNRLAATAKWGDAPLRHAYYKGLPDRIKDSLVHVEKPKNLQALRLAAQHIDVRYWERRSEKSREPPAKSDNKNDKSNNTSDNNNKSHKSKSGNKGNNSSNSGNKSSNTGSNTGNQKKPDLSDKLGKDGKLTPEERQRRFDNNLCMFCGRSGHVAKDCPKSSSSSAKTKARSAKADTAKVEESKN
jgi:Zinc knuckle